MTAKIVRLRPPRHVTVADAFEIVEAAAGNRLSEPSRRELAEIAEPFREPAKAWKYTMLSGDQIRTVLRLINASSKPAITLRVWTALVSHVEMDTGEVMAGRKRLAEDAGTTPAEVSRALTRLAEMGALIRLQTGRYNRYMVNPNVAWVGSLARRQAAAKDAPPLRLVETT